MTEYFYQCNNCGKEIWTEYSDMKGDRCQECLEGHLTYEGHSV